MTFVVQQYIQGGKGGIDRQDVSWRAVEAVCRPSLDHVPVESLFFHHVDRRGEDVHMVAQDGEEKRCSQAMTEEGRQAHPRGGEPLDRHEGCLGLSQSFSKVRGGGERRSEP